VLAPTSTGMSTPCDIPVDVDASHSDKMLFPSERNGG
jgi:hypothetical protein